MVPCHACYEDGQACRGRSIHCGAATRMAGKCKRQNHEKYIELVCFLLPAHKGRT